MYVVNNVTMVTPPPVTTLLVHGEGGQHNLQKARSNPGEGRFVTKQDVLAANKAASIAKKGHFNCKKGRFNCKKGHFNFKKKGVSIAKKDLKPLDKKGKTGKKRTKKGQSFSRVIPSLFYTHFTHELNSLSHQITAEKRKSIFFEKKYFEKV